MYEELKKIELLCKNCDKCQLSKTRTNVVFSDGIPNNKLMLIGEAPGYYEDQEGKPFVGRSGQLLDKILESVGLSRKKDLYICNVIKCRPPDNRNPLPEEQISCRKYLNTQIDILKPRIILLCVIGVLIIITVVIGVTYSFMRPINETSSETKVSLNACANLTLKDTDTVVELSNSYPMSKNKALQTTPYTFTLTSSCGDRTAYSIYLATLNTNTLADNNIHYILTKGGSKEIITEGILSNATNAISEFNSYEQSELNTGIKETFSKIYKIYFNQKYKIILLQVLQM